MAYLVTFHWGWLLASFLLGLAMGWISVVQHGGLSSTVQRWLTALVALLVGVALARLVPGRAGYWLDLALVMFGFYIAGCVIGASLRDWVVSRHRPVT